MDARRLKFGGDFKQFILGNIHIIEKLTKEDAVEIDLGTVDFEGDPIDDVVELVTKAKEGSKGKCVFYYYGKGFKTRRSDNEYGGWTIEVLLSRGNEKLSFIFIFVDKPENLYKLSESKRETLKKIVFSELLLRC